MMQVVQLYLLRGGTEIGYSIQGSRLADMINKTMDKYLVKIN